MKPYCTQNNGDCSTCSLINYGRDCQNHEGADWVISVSGTQEIVSILSWRAYDHTAAEAARNKAESTDGRVMYLSKLADWIN